jgi:predicted Rossmann-fold nucleotide-binding protein
LAEEKGHEMKVLVCGGRDFADFAMLSEEMMRLLAERDVDAIIHGGARGADSMAGEFANATGIEEIVFPADWKKYGRRAGPIRNQQMLDEGKPDLVVAFPGGRGTADMVERARAAGIEVRLAP